MSEDQAGTPPRPREDEEPSSAATLAEYWGVVVKRWKLVAACVGSALAWAVLATALTRPSYRATTVLDIEPDGPTPMDVGATAQLFYLYNPEYLPTQLRLLRSREMAERAVRQLALGGDRELAPKSGVLGGPPAAGPERRADDATARAALAILGGLGVEQIKDTNLVELSYVDSNPARAAKVANAVAEAFIGWTAESRFRAVGDAARYLSSQIEQLRSELDARQKALLQFGGDKNAGAVDSQLTGSLQGSDSMKTEYATAVADRIAKEAHYRELQSTPDEALGESSPNSVPGQLRAEQARLEREYAEKLNVFKPDWPAMRELKAQIDRSREHVRSAVRQAAAKVRENARMDFLTAQRREEGFRDTMRLQQEKAVEFSSSNIEFNNLRVEVEAKRNLLDALLKKQSETEMMARTAGQRQSPVRIVDPALTPTYRFAPSYRRSVPRGLAIGLVAGLALVFSFELFDRSLRSPEEVESYLGLPAIGVIPGIAGSGRRSRGYGYGYGYGGREAGGTGEETPIELLPHAQPRSAVAEAYRAARTALLLSRAGGVRSITVTSCHPREGKSVTAVNLAAVLGQLGKKVLVIDADLHKPRLHEILRVTNRSGLVSILAENADPSTVIVRTEIPGVFAVTTGPATPNPSGLLSSEAMAIFLRRACATFDFVLVDTPPVLPVADAILIAHQTDGVLLCVRGGVTPREPIRRVRDKLLRSGARILGVLINDADTRRGSEYRRHFGYTAPYAGGPSADVAGGGAPRRDRVVSKG